MLYTFPIRLPAVTSFFAAEMMHKVISTQPTCYSNPQRLLSRLKEVLTYELLATAIREFWMAPVNQKSASWVEHLDINSVMLATTITPEGYVSI